MRAVCKNCFCSKTRFAQTVLAEKFLYSARLCRPDLVLFLGFLMHRLLFAPFAKFLELYLALDFLLVLARPIDLPGGLVPDSYELDLFGHGG